MTLLAAIAALMVIVATIAILLANRLLVVPLLRIAGQLKHIEDFRLDRITRVASPRRKLDKLSGIQLQMGRGLAWFQKYMPLCLGHHLPEMRPDQAAEISELSQKVLAPQQQADRLLF